MVVIQFRDKAMTFVVKQQVLDWGKSQNQPTTGLRVLSDQRRLVVLDNLRAITDRIAKRTGARYEIVQ